MTTSPPVISGLCMSFALGEADRSDVMWDILRRTDPPSYGAQLAKGATTLTEAWDANPNSSQNHLMLGHAEIWFYEYLAGIQIDMTRDPPEQITIAPAIVGDLKWVRASYEANFGRIAVTWNRRGDKIHLSVTIPPNSSATVHLPDGSDPVVVSSEPSSFVFNG